MAASIKCRVHVFPAPGVETRATGFENVLGGANEMSQFWLGGLICELFVVVSFLDSVVVVFGGTVELLETVEILGTFSEICADISGLGIDCGIGFGIDF